MATITSASRSFAACLIAAAAACILWDASVASARPGVIVAQRVDAFAEPSDSADVVAELGRGAAVVVFDDESATDVVTYRRAGWVAIRIPGSGGVGYVRAEAVDPGPAGTSNPAETHVASAPPAREWSPPPTEPRDQSSAVEQGAPASDGRAGRFLPRAKARFQLGIGSGAAWLRRASAMENRIGDSGPTFNVSGALLLADIVSLSGDVGAIFPRDNASFSQPVEPVDGGGNSFTADSSLNLARYGFEGGALRSCPCARSKSPSRIDVLVADACVPSD